MTALRQDHGTTLVELLLSVMFLGLFAAVMQQFSRTILRGTRVLEVASEAQEASSIGIQLILQDLREAGFDPTDSIRHGIRQARRDAIEIVRDLDGDGETDDRNEVVGYSFNADKRALMRSMGDAPAQPMLNDLGPGGLSFTYFAAQGVLLPVGKDGLDANARNQVRRIDVQLAIEMPHPDPAYETPIRTEAKASISLRNG